MTHGVLRKASDIGARSESEDQAQITAHRLEGWLKEHVASLLEVDVQAIGDDESFARLGLDSAAAIAMTGDLAQWLGCEIDAMAPYEFSTIATLSRHLGTRPDVQAALAEKNVRP
jgi:acyl carrier protein